MDYDERSGMFLCIRFFIKFNAHQMMKHIRCVRCQITEYALHNISIHSVDFFFESLEKRSQFLKNQKRISFHEITILSSRFNTHIHRQQPSVRIYKYDTRIYEYEYINVRTNAHGTPTYLGHSLPTYVILHDSRVQVIRE